jgi:hypothetical protein
MVDFGLSRLRLPSGEILFNAKSKYTDEFLPHMDLQRVKESLKTSCIVWEYADNKEEELKLLHNFRKRMDTDNPLSLLSHPFFASLQSHANPTNMVFYHLISSLFFDSVFLKFLYFRKKMSEGVTFSSLLQMDKSPRPIDL